MKIFIFALLIGAISASILEDNEKFQAFKLEHGKIYKSKDEEMKRFKIFRDNLMAIEKHNALYEQGFESYKQGVNEYTDMTEKEFKVMHSLTPSNKPKFESTEHVISGLSLPESVDWRNSGQITSIKNQGSCGSCWAFALTGTVEAAYFRKTQKLVELSQQQLLDCTTNVNHGCGGGFLDYTMPILEQNGLEADQSYPYLARVGSCQYSSSKVVTKISSYVNVGYKNENGLRDAVANVGPVAITLNSTLIKQYAAGIIELASCTEPIDHAVLVVGYGSENGKDYWIAKNSWGTGWGEKGYFRIVRGKNECALASDGVYPIIK